MQKESGRSLPQWSTEDSCADAARPRMQNTPLFQRSPLRYTKGQNSYLPPGNPELAHKKHLDPFCATKPHDVTFRVAPALSCSVRKGSTCAPFRSARLLPTY